MTQYTVNFGKRSLCTQKRMCVLLLLGTAPVLNLSPYFVTVLTVLSFQAPVSPAMGLPAEHSLISDTKATECLLTHIQVSCMEFGQAVPFL